MIDFMLKLPADGLESPKRCKRSLVVALRRTAFGRHMMHRATVVDDKGNPVDGGWDITTGSHDIAILVIPDLMTKRGVYGTDEDGNSIEIRQPEFDGPHLMVRIPTKAGKTKATWKEIRRQLPLGVRIRPNPGTIEWFGG